MAQATPSAKRVLIAGGGVAALEAALALRALADGRASVELLAPEPHFWYRPMSVVEPFGLGDPQRYALGALAAAAGATCTLGSLRGVDARRRLAKTSIGDMPYDALLIAVGAVPLHAVPGALTFRGPADTDKLRDLLAEVEAGEVRRIAFAVPRGAVWSLPVYELALMTAAHARRRGLDWVESIVVTPEEEPLMLFGPSGRRAARQLLDEQGVEVLTRAYPSEFAGNELQLSPEGSLSVDRVVALPRLIGPRLDGVPQTIDRFVPIDRHGRVAGLEAVYAAGDIANFPIKQGGLAAQLADAAAESIAAALGAHVDPTEFRPVLRGLLLTGGRPHYMRRELTGIDEVDTASPDPLWWPPAKIVGRHLAPFLAALAGSENVGEPEPPPGAVEIEVELADADLASLAAVPLHVADGDGHTVADVMSPDVLVVAPEDTLGEVAEKMRSADTGSAAVADHGRLIGILTSRDLLRAFASRVHPSEARVRGWMTAEPLAVTASTPVTAAMSLMDTHEVHHLPVVEGDRPVGMLGYRQAARVRAVGIGLGF